MMSSVMLQKSIKHDISFYKSLNSLLTHLLYSVLYYLIPAVAGKILSLVSCAMFVFTMFVTMTTIQGKWLHYSRCHETFRIDRQWL